MFLGNRFFTTFPVFVFHKPTTIGNYITARTCGYEFQLWFPSSFCAIPSQTQANFSPFSFVTRTAFFLLWSHFLLIVSFPPIPHFKNHSKTFDGFKLPLFRDEASVFYLLYAVTFVTTFATGLSITASHVLTVRSAATIENIMTSVQTN